MTIDNNVNTIIFDLDGTLIDSSAGIIAAMKASFASVGQAPIKPLSSSIIGPPLHETLVLLAGTADSGLIDALKANFKMHYDQECYKQTTAFSGISEMLAELAAHKITLYIATNKRIKPTRLILSYFGWSDFFSAVYALDSVHPVAMNKGALLRRVISENNIDLARSVYIGDRNDDQVAAEANALKFAMASWGYEAAPKPNSSDFIDENVRGDYISLSSPEKLTSFYTGSDNFGLSVGRS